MEVTTPEARDLTLVLAQVILDHTPVRLVATLEALHLLARAIQERHFLFAIFHRVSVEIMFKCEQTSCPGLKPILPYLENKCVDTLKLTSQDSFPGFVSKRFLKFCSKLYQK